MDTEAKHGLPKVMALADKLAWLVIDQIEKDGHINLENIRNALVGPLARDEMDRNAIDVQRAGGMLVNTGGLHVKCMCPECEAEGRYLKGVKKLAEGITENMFTPCLGRSSRVFEGVDVAKPLEGVKGPVGNVGPIGPAGSGQIQLWAHRRGPNGPQGRRIVAATRPQLKALGDAIASGKAQRVSISDGTYVLPDGEVLTEREMIMRSGTDGRRS